MPPSFTLAALVAGATLLLAWLSTAGVRRHALKRRLLDVPNARSSHTVPTPRGGGVAIVAAFAAGAAVLSAMGWVSGRTVATVLPAALMVAVLGYVDDRVSLPARLRFVGHCIAAAWVLVALGPLPPAPMFGVDVPLGPAAGLLGTVYIVWSINLFNFMDGIDGLASVQAISVALGGAVVGALVLPPGSGALEWVLAAAVGGFLLWNFPPARIFMGDAGSGFLGLVVAVLSLIAAQAHPPLFWSWLILNGCFMVDATTTLVRRKRKGERVHEAHRNHAYQYAARRWRSHRRVTLACGAINVAWLLPLAAAVAVGWVDGAVGLIVAYAPLVALALRLKAGDRAAQAAAEGTP